MFSTLYILSPNFHTLALSGPCFTLLLLNLILCPRLCVPWVSLILPRWPSGSVGAYCMPLFSSTLTGASLWLSILVLWVVPCSVVLVGSSLCFSALSPFACCVPLLARVSSVPLCFSPLHKGSRLCCLWCVWLSPPSLGCSRVVSWPNQAPAVLIPPSGYLIASCDGLVASPVAWSVVVLCFLASCCSTAAKAFGPVRGTGLPSTPWACVAVGAVRSFTEVFIFMMIQVPP